ncbi:acyltransferase [Paraburkholderia ultramafica]|uniref:acyltransferase n=1 Tax=Paraburkholderia ultramafica TaxID=1544867 RepID=UPI003CCDCA07
MYACFGTLNIVSFLPLGRVYTRPTGRRNFGGSSHVWFGCRCTVLKGAEIGDNVVVAATSTITAKHEQPNTVIGGSPVRVLKESVEWEA